MAYIADVPLAKAEGPTQLIYREILSAFGFLPHFWEAQGTRPDLMRANVELWGKIYRNGVLSPALKEEILLVVSAANLNVYCIIAHLKIARATWRRAIAGTQANRRFGICTHSGEGQGCFTICGEVDAPTLGGPPGGH